MVIRPLVWRLLKTTPKSTKMSRMWYLEPCVSALRLQIPDSQFQEYSLRRQGTLMPPVNLFLEVPGCSWRPCVFLLFLCLLCGGLISSRVKENHFPHGGKKPPEAPSASFKCWSFRMCGPPHGPSGTPQDIRKVVCISFTGVMWNFRR